MKRAIRAAMAGVGAASVLAGCAWAQEAAPPVDMPELEAWGLKPIPMPRIEQWDIVSKITGRTYRIFVTRPLPSRPVGPGGAPVAYILDGNVSFRTGSDAAWTAAMGPQVKPALVVGIGYPTEDMTEIGALRGGDMFPHAEDFADPKHAAEFSDLDREEIAGALPAGVPGPAGAEKFYRFIKEELEPRLKADYGPIDPSQSVLWGHSAGGLFVLETLFKHPEAFRSYVVSSPAIWFQERRVLKGEAAFTEKVRSGKVRPRVLILSGGDEGKPYPADRPLPPGLPPEITREVLTAIDAQSRMFDNARELADRLAKVQNLTVSYQVFEGEDHGTMVPASLGRGMIFGLAEEGFYGNKPPSR